MSKKVTLSIIKPALAATSRDSLEACKLELDAVRCILHCAAAALEDSDAVDGCDIASQARNVIDEANKRLDQLTDDFEHATMQATRS